MSNAKDPRIVDIMRVVEKLTDDDPRQHDPSGIYWILEALGESMTNAGYEREARDMHKLMGAVCDAANSRWLDVMHAEALEQERINAEIREDAEKAGAA
ncbi:MAG: hypothetical protein AB7T06_41715 [Kofleriaceae bacterium]